MPHSPTSVNADTFTQGVPFINAQKGVSGEAYHSSSNSVTTSSNGSAIGTGRAITKSNSASNSFNGSVPPQYYRDLWAQRSLSHPNTFYANGNPAAAAASYPFVYSDYPHQGQFFTSQNTYSATPYKTFDKPAYARPLQANLQAQQNTNLNNTRFIRPPLSPPTNHGEDFTYPTSDANEFVEKSNVPSTSANELATELAKGLSVANSMPSKWANSSPTSGSVDLEDSDSEEDEQSSHPNKFPVEIEYHDNKYCLYKRQPTRSGMKVKQMKSSVYDPMTSESRSQMQQIKYYQKDLVRICRCGQYNQMDGALVHGRANDCDGYEIHYSQKCKWKAYDDYKTGKRVLIRLCKCYKPMA